jgi:hypothetical protein
MDSTLGHQAIKSESGKRATTSAPRPQHQQEQPQRAPPITQQPHHSAPKPNQPSARLPK